MPAAPMTTSPTPENSPPSAAEPEPEPPLFDDAEDEGSRPGPKPWDPARIRIGTKTPTIREVADQIREGDIDLAPDFQRDFIWKQRQRTRLVESILLGIPLPAFYFNQEADGRYQVVDGVQRLSTIKMFMDGGHVLRSDDLEYLSDLADKAFGTLDPATMRRFRSTTLVVHVIEPQTPDEVKYDIFSRVNTLGSPLSAQEIRHAMSKGRSRGFLKHLAELNEFDEATANMFWRRNPDSTPIPIRDSHRMADREMVLRYCAFRDYDERYYRRFESLDAFLMDFTRRIDGRSDHGPNLSDAELDRLDKGFRQSMINASKILGKAAFRRWPTWSKRRGPINRAVFEAQALALAEYSLETLDPVQGKIVDRFRSLFNDPSFTRAVTAGTGDPANIAVRLGRTRDTLSEVLR